MTRKAELITHMSDFGNHTCEIGHDINNILSILMGYNEELEEMIEDDELDMKMIQRVHSKFNVAIDRLQKMATDVALIRNDDLSEEKNVDLANYYHRSLKLMTAAFKTWNIKPIYRRIGDHFSHKAKSDEFNIFLCELFGSWWHNWQPSELTNVEFFAETLKDTLILSWKCDEEELPSDFPEVKWMGQSLEFEKLENEVRLSIPCQAVENNSESVA